LLEEIPNSDLEFVKRKVGLNDEVAMERFAASGGREGSVKRILVVGEIVVIDAMFTTVGEYNGGLVELHFGHNGRDNRWGDTGVVGNVQADDGVIGVYAISKGGVVEL
jgi:hypothetical protein